MRSQRAPGLQICVNYGQHKNDWSSLPKNWRHFENSGQGTVVLDTGYGQETLHSNDKEKSVFYMGRDYGISHLCSLASATFECLLVMRGLINDACLDHIFQELLNNLRKSPETAGGSPFPCGGIIWTPNVWGYNWTTLSPGDINMEARGVGDWKSRPRHRKGWPSGVEAEALNNLKEMRHYKQGILVIKDKIEEWIMKCSDFTIYYRGRQYNDNSTFKRWKQSSGEYICIIVLT